MRYCPRTSAAAHETMFIRTLADGCIPGATHHIHPRRHSGGAFSGAGTMGGMSDKDNKRRSIVATIVIALVILLLLLPVFYVLSAGPALWLVHHGYLDALTFFSLYRPLMAYAYDHETFNSVMNWYMSWWGGPIDLSS